jgi:polysaccharide chain length determinant protein (PEP-CTERM system associated)
MLPQKFDLDNYKRALSRRKLYIIVPFLLIFIAGACYVSTRPKLYRAWSTLMVEGQQVPLDYVRSNVTTDFKQRMNTIMQQLTTRASMERLIKEFDLYSGPDHSTSEVTMQAKVERLRDDISIEFLSGGSLRIACIGTSPWKITQVANKLASRFIEENLKVREEQSIGTTQFLDSELARVEAILKQKEVELTAYKQQNLGTLPEDSNLNLRIMEQLGQKVTSMERSLDEANTQKILLQKRISNLKSGNVKSGADTAPGLPQIREQLKALRLRYTENHPDIIRLRNMLAQMTNEQERQEPTTEEASMAENASSPTVTDPTSTGELEDLQFQMAEVERRIKTLQTDKGKMEKRIGELGRLVEAAPKKQLDLAALQRDYTAFKSQYDSLLNKKLQSQLGENLERRQKGEQFQIIERARPPQKPFSPNIPKFMLMVMLGGLAAGFGLAFAMEYLDQSFRDYNDLSETLQLPVLAVIPWLETSREARRRRNIRLIAYCGSACFLIGIDLGIWLWLTGNLQHVLQKVQAVF